MASCRAQERDRDIPCAEGLSPFVGGAEGRAAAIAETDAGGGEAYEGVETLKPRHFARFRFCFLQHDRHGRKKGSGFFLTAPNNPLHLTAAAASRFFRAHRLTSRRGR